MHCTCPLLGVKRTCNRQHTNRRDDRTDTEVTMMKTDEDAIRAIELQFNEAWGRHDANGMVGSLIDDAQFVTVNGAWTKTRADYLNLMQRLHGPTDRSEQHPRNASHARSLSCPRHRDDALGVPHLRRH